MFKCQTQEGSVVELESQFVQGAYLPAITRCNQYLTTSPDANTPIPTPVFYDSPYELKYISHDMTSVVVSINKSISFFTVNTDHVFLKDVDSNSLMSVMVYYDGVHIIITLEEGYLDSTYFVLLSGVRDITGSPLPSISTLPFVARTNFSSARIFTIEQVTAISFVIRLNNTLIESNSVLNAVALVNLQAVALIGVSSDLEAIVEPNSDATTVFTATPTVSRNAYATIEALIAVEAMATIN